MKDRTLLLHNGIYQKRTYSGTITTILVLQTFSILLFENEKTKCIFQCSFFISFHQALQMNLLESIAHYMGMVKTS